jgi:hypothetical protein
MFHRGRGLPHLTGKRQSRREAPVDRREMLLEGIRGAGKLLAVALPFAGGLGAVMAAATKPDSPQKPACFPGRKPAIEDAGTAATLSDDTCTTHEEA